MSNEPSQPNSHDPDQGKPRRQPPPSSEDAVFDEIEIVPEEGTVKLPQPVAPAEDAVEVIAEDAIIDITEADVLAETSGAKKPVRGIPDEVEIVGETAGGTLPPPGRPKTHAELHPQTQTGMGGPPTMGEGINEIEIIPESLATSKTHAELRPPTEALIGGSESILTEEAFSPDDIVDVTEEATESSRKIPRDSEEVLSEDDIVDVTEEAEESSRTIPKAADSVPGDSGSDLDGLHEEVLVEGGSEVGLAKPESGRGMTSGVDLIAEALESGVDLSSEGPRSPGAVARKPRDEEALDLDSVHDHGTEPSSSVDLGGLQRPKRKSSKRSEPPKPAEEAADIVDAEEVVEEAAATPAEGGAAIEDEEDIFHLPKTEGKGTLEDLIEEAPVSPKALGKAKAKGKPEAVSERKKKPARARGGASRMLAGVGLGILLTLGMVGGIWYFAPDLLQSIPESPGMPGAKWQKLPKAVVLPPAGQTASLATEARELIDKGELDLALAKLKDVDEGEVLVVRGEALWQKYLKEQHDKGAALDPNDPAVKSALADFKKAGNEHYPVAIDRVLKTDQAIRARLATLEAADHAVRGVLAKANLLPKDEKDLARAVSGALVGNEQAAGLMANMRQILLDARLLDEKEQLTAESFKTLTAELAEARGAAEALRKYLNVKPAEMPKVVMTLDATRKTLDDKLQLVNEALKGAGTKSRDGAGVQELASAQAALKEQKAVLDNAVDLALKELQTVNPVPPGGDPAKQLVEGIRAARLKAESPLGASLNQMFSALGNLGGGFGKVLQRGVEMADQSLELAAARARLALSETPEQRLDTAISLYRSRDRKDPQDLERAMKLHAWASAKESKATAETKAKALWALGLAQRNEGQTNAAVQSLQEAETTLAALQKAPAWANELRQALYEMTDPAAYYLPRVRQLQGAGKAEAALAELEEGLKAMPGHPQLLALRGTLRVESGAIDAASMTTLRADALAIQKNPQHAAAGFYLLGQLEERLGNLGKAEEHYRKALKAHQGSEEEASTYRRALARLLLREPPAANSSMNKGTTAGPSAPDGEEDETSATAAWMILTLTALQFPEQGEDEAAARLREAMKLAEELARSSDPKTKGQGLMLMGQVLSKQGKRSEGMLRFVEGLRLFYDNKDIEELDHLMQEHPAFHQPESTVLGNPLLAERHYGQGLGYYWSGRYSEAETEFARAAGYFDQDARYFYFLGLARYQQAGQKKRDAALFAFSQGAALEAASLPHRSQVNASLERIQGAARQLLNGFRQSLRDGS